MVLTGVRSSLDPLPLRSQVLLVVPQKKLERCKFSTPNLTMAELTEHIRIQDSVRRRQSPLSRPLEREQLIHGAQGA